MSPFQIVVVTFVVVPLYPVVFVSEQLRFALTVAGADVDDSVEVPDASLEFAVGAVTAAHNESSSLVTFRPCTNIPFVQLHAPSTSNCGANGSAHWSEDSRRRFEDAAARKRRPVTND